MAKGYRIKRHSSRIYRKDRSKSHSPFAVLGTVGLLIGLFVVGWFVYPPVYDLIIGKNAEITPSSSASQPEPSQEAKPVAPTEPEQPVPVEAAAIKALYAPPELVRDAARLDAFLRQAGTAGYNALLFDGKDDTGKVLYQTANATATASGAVTAKPFDLKAVVALLEQYHMKPIVRLHAFKDHIASGKNAVMAVKYQGQDMFWLDNYPDRGGKTWLNPYSVEAQDYIIALAQECADNGARMVLVDSVQFPNAIGMELATYGATQGKSKAQVLSGFVGRLETALTAKGGELAVYTPVSAVMEIGGLDYLGKPAAYGSMLAINAMPALWGAGSEVAGLVNPLQKPYDTMLTTLRAAQGKTQAKLLPFVQAYTDQKAPIANNMPYGKAEVAAQLDALAELKLESYILYSPTGEYQF